MPPCLALLPAPTGACRPRPPPRSLRTGRELLVKVAELVPKHPGRANRKPSAPQPVIAAASGSGGGAGPSKQQQAGGSKKKSSKKK